MLKLLLPLVTVLFAILCSGPVLALEKVVATETYAEVNKVKNYIRMVDNVVILFDTSGSMTDLYQASGKTKLQVAKDLLKQRVEVFPDVFPEINVGLYSYSPPIGVSAEEASGRGYDVFYKMQPFDKAAFLEAVDSLPTEADGPTLIQNALSRLDDLLEKLSGPTAVFIFTDGSYSDMSPEVSAEGGVTEQDKAAKSPVGMAKSLAQKYNVSFQLISTTDVATNQELIKQIATVNASSRVWPIETLLERPETFTGAVFAIEESYIVNARERENVVGFELDHILFDFDKVDIDIQFTEELEAVGKLVRDNPDSYIVLAGFTDSQGTEEYNLGLSKRRVEAVKDYLVNKFQIAEERIGAFWYGEAAPIADNNTEAGRQKNRRVLGYITGVK